ncbi:hypothetical protein D3OALGA1CA_4567 [Olavius algarvensis associated proteobacterium Delta 3]|nr:hypothetical protein D3OALGA1CA_4567 [Olavius algarvensis associated proteobacterium Delta 3]
MLKPRLCSFSRYGWSMGIGFLAKATEMRRLGQTWLNTVTSIEGILFLLSLLAPVFLLIHRSISM